MNINELYDLAHEITSDMEYINKYTFLTYHNIIKCRYLDINDTITVKTPINAYIQTYETVLLIPNFINNFLVTLFIRPLTILEKPLTYGITTLPFGIGSLTEDFKYGDTLFVVEGMGDLGALKLLNPNINVVALMTNSFAKNSYEVYASITDSIVMIPDNDLAGMSQLQKIKTNFSKHNVDFKYFTQFGNLKDLGEVVDLLIDYRKGSIHLKEEIELIKSYYNFNTSLFYTKYLR